MQKLFLPTVMVFLLIFLGTSAANSQESKRDLYQQQIEMLQQQGTYEPPSCLTDKLPTNANLRSSQPSGGATNSISTVVCDISLGYGTEGLVSSDATANANPNDPACSVTPPTSCGGANVYRVPIAITVFEDQGWTGQNYLDNNGSVGGFLALSDADINASIADLNAAYGNASIEFYEAVPRSRVEDADLFNFYRTNADPEDGIEDDGQTSAYDVPNVINVYFVGGMDGDHDCCGITGYAPYPPSRDYFLMVYRGTFGTTLEHEFGHYFGLAHTHVDGLSSGDTGTMLDNSDCLTTGDGICDTWPDPNFQNCRAPSCVYQEGGVNCPTLTIDPASGVDQGGAVSTILQNNIMGYNSFSGCRTSFTPCQYDKLQDVLLGCRANLCDATLVRAANTSYEICVGESAPTLTAISSCYNWYSDTGDGTVALASNTSSFTPTIGVGAGLLDNMTPGTYTFYLGDAIEYNPDCRTAIEIVVFGDPGDGSPAVASFSGVSTTSLSTDVTDLGDFEVIGWWVTENTGVSIGDFVDQAALDAALAAANAGGGTISTNPVNHIFPSTSGSPINMLDLTMDCGSLDDGITYFATPFISTLEPAIPDATCVETDAGSNVSVSGDLGQWAFVDAGTVSCAPASPPNNPTYTLTVNVTAYSGAPNNLRLRVRGNGCSGGNLISQTVAGVGTYTFTEADFAAGYDPNVGGLCVLVYESGSGGGGSGIAINISLDITYPGTTAIPFPTVNYSSCLFGAPVMINCLVPTPVKLSYFTAQKQGKASLLNWETASELNNDFFTVEHSMDGRNFTAIEQVKGAGNAETPILYQVLDRNPQNGINYYRLKQTDFDGTFTYSSIVSVTFSDLVELKVIPNPVAKNDILVEYHASGSGNLTIEIIDITGKIMSVQELSATVGKNNLTIDISTFNQGIYILRTQQGNDIQTMRFVRL